MKFDNAVSTVKEAREVALPLGTGIVKFTTKYLDARSTEYVRLKAKISKPVRKLVEIDALDPAKDREIAVRTYVQHCVTGWSGVTSDGAEVPYSEDACVDLLMQVPTLFYSLVDEASTRDNFLPTPGDAGN